MGESMEKAGKIVVVAVTKIPRGSRSAYLHLSRSSSFLHDVGSLVNSNVQVGIWTNCEIQPLNMAQLPPFWPKLIKIAPDCHAQNVQLSRVSRTEVILQATKDITSGEELLLWFDEDLLMDEMGIPPYLSPVNIRGGNSYICNICGHSFEAPNNLKVHIALKCDTFPVSVLWGRLASSSSTSPKPVSSPWSAFQNPSTSPPPNDTPPSSLVSILVKNQLPHPHVRMHFSSFPLTTAPLPHHSSRHSLVVTSSSSSNNSTPSSAHISSSLQINSSSNRNNNGHKPSTTNRPSKPRSTNGHHVPQSGKRCGNPSVEKTISVSVSDPEAQLESIVSNMGKARNGHHMCLYCGKLYSRKYGLKIHIRTHTGYKPLRCKICHRPFGDPSNLNKHIRLHSDGNTPYRCDICQKVLVRKRDLERHIRSRHHTLGDPAISISIPDGMALDCSRTSAASHFVDDVDVLSLNT